MRKKYVIANWKMNPIGSREAGDLFRKIKSKVQKFRNVKIIICPPAIYLKQLSSSYSGNKIFFGAQNSFWEDKGSFTGEISPLQIKDLNVDFVILGHSERRENGETDEIVNKKIKKALGAGLNVILCVGEKERDDDGSHLHFIENQIRACLSGVSKNNTSKLILAYEPIWAIGKSSEFSMKPSALHQTKLFILKILKDVLGADGMKIPVIYGGSSEPTNSGELIEEGEVDGLLVGHESLVPSDFIEIIKIVNSAK
jgi:triosephosphate isomerase (TIM)